MTDNQRVVKRHLGINGDCALGKSYKHVFWLHGECKLAAAFFIMIYCLVINELIISIFETKISYQFATIVVADRLRAFNVKTVQKL